VLRGTDEGVSVVPEPPAADDADAATAKQYDDNDSDDDSSVAFLGFFTWSNRHIRHNFFSL
jgi:hypothetical protein